MKHILSVLSRRYPQLLFPIVAGISTSSEYRDAVYFGKEHAGSIDYSMSEKDKFMRVDTPVGSIDVLLLYNRKDFEKCVCALANRCEPRVIPETVGAFMISGLINWEEARKHHNEQMKKDCYDRIILLCSGWYSGVSPEKVGLPNQDWLEKSIIIRMYHEIAHFVCRSLYPNNIDSIRDEVFADMIGMIMAFGNYDYHRAKLFLGIEDTEILDNARIRYYLNNQKETSVINEVEFWISWLCERQNCTTGDIFELMIRTFDEMVCVTRSF